MFKKILLVTALMGLAGAANATTFQQRLEMPNAGDTNFSCQTNPRISISYYIDPVTGDMWTVFWEESVSADPPYDLEWMDIEVEFPATPRTGQVRKKCGFSRQEQQWLKKRHDIERSKSIETIKNQPRTFTRRSFP